MEMIGVDENDNKPEVEDASHDYVDDLNDAVNSSGFIGGRLIRQ